MAIIKGITWGLVGLALGYSQPVGAQTPYLNVQGSNFDLWCQEHEKLPPERCDKRSPEDEKAYEAYRDKIGDDEEKLRLDRQRNDQRDRTILHNDPIDNPGAQVPAQQPPAADRPQGPSP
jgi:hypothetical protein